MEQTEFFMIGTTSTDWRSSDHLIFSVFSSQETAKQAVEAAFGKPLEWFDPFATTTGEASHHLSVGPHPAPGILFISISPVTLDFATEATDHIRRLISTQKRPGESTDP